MTTVIFLSSELANLLDSQTLEHRDLTVARVATVKLPGLVAVALLGAAAVALVRFRRRGYAQGYVDGAARRPADEKSDWTSRRWRMR